VFFPAYPWQPGNVLPPEIYELVDPIEACIGSCHPYGIWGEVERFHRRITEFGGCERENARPSPQIQERLRLVRPAKDHQLAQTEQCGRVLAGAKAQAWIQYNDGLTLPGRKSAPTWLNEQLPSDRNRLKMPLP
jgi:hypothetical protein